MPARHEVEAALAEAHRREWAVVLAATMRAARDLDLAEECVQEAYTAALVAWTRHGVPERPGAWLTTAARRRAIDAVRRASWLRPRLPLLVFDGGADDEAWPGDGADPDEEPSVADERLRLIFMCCHPALAPEAQLGLTLRLVCGLGAADIARVLLVTESTMHARLTRAKRKVAVARIPVRVPGAAELPDRLATVLGVIYLLFTIGHAAPSGDTLVRPELVDEALRVARTLRELMPDEREVAGLLALLVVIDARRGSRTSATGLPVPLDAQDRSTWDAPAIAEAHDLVVAGLRGGRPGRYTLQAAIASLHAEAPSYEATDWPQILRLYDELLVVWPSPAAALSRAVARAMVDGPALALADVEALASDRRLDGYHYLPAVRAHLLDQLGRTEAADEARREALSHTSNEMERAYLEAQLARATPSGRLAP